MEMHIRQVFIGVVVLGLAACATEAAPTQTVTAVPLPEAAAEASSSSPSSAPSVSANDASTSPTPSTSATQSAAPPADASIATASASPSAPPPAVPDEDLPGELIDFGPVEGSVLAVIGVAHDDHLNLRAGPGTDQDVLAQMAPTQDDIVAQGATRVLPDFWYQVEVDGTIGWASARFLAQLGPVDDITAAVIDDIGSRPTAGSMEDLGRIVAESQASDEKGISRLVMVVAPSETGDVGEVTWDVVGLADDSVRGLRLHVFGTPTGMGFTLDAVERTLLCDRGVSPEGLCT